MIANTPTVTAKATALAAAAKLYGLTNTDLAAATGYTLDQVNTFLASATYGSSNLTGAQISSFVQANISSPATIATAAKQYGLTNADLAAATGYTLDQVNNFLTSVGAKEGGLMALRNNL